MNESRSESITEVTWSREENVRSGGGWSVRAQKKKIGYGEMSVVLKKRLHTRSGFPPKWTREVENPGRLLYFYLIYLFEYINYAFYLNINYTKNNLI